jgi:GntR family transcriptional regulator/MocR family aminotransferase
VRSLSGRALLVTHGSQEALLLVALLLLAPGDAVAVEDPGYPPAWEAFRAAGARLVPVPVDAQGLDVAALTRTLDRHPVRLIYTTPLHQYPTCVTMPMPRRLELLELSARRGVPVLEDDYDHEYHYRATPMPPLAAHAAAGHVLYVASFSKLLFPSARIGVLAASAAFVEKATRLRRATARAGDRLLQAALARFLADGGLERHLRRTRLVHEARRDAFAQALGAGGDDVEFALPDGGVNLWARIGRGSSRTLAERALQHGIRLSPDTELHGDGRSQARFRLGFARHTPDEMQRGVRLLLQLARERRR